MSGRRPFRGWLMVAVGFLIYGLGMAPAYYGWGYLAPESIADLGLSRAQVGNVFGLFTLTFALASPLAAMAMTRFGLRPVVTLGAAIAAIGFWRTSLATSVGEITVTFALVGGIGVGLSSLLPAQALPVFWFRRYRARATAVILLGAAVVGAGVPAIANWILQTQDWRVVWRGVAGVSIGVGLLAALVLRERPEHVGQQPDGEDSLTALVAAPPGATPADEPSTFQAILTPQFAIITFACLANTLPWRVFTAHGRLHFEDLGFASSVAAAILGLRVGMSAFGRLGGSIGDFADPRHVLAVSLCVVALGMAGLALSSSTTAAYVCIVLLGLGYGVGFTSEPVVLAKMFGTRAFVGSNGLRIAIAGVAGWIGPTLAGAAADQSNSYTATWVVLAGTSVLGVLALLCVRPLRR